MMYEIEIEMKKGDNRVAVNVREVNDLEFDDVRDKTLNRVREAWALIPSSNSGKTDTQVVTKEVYTQEVKAPTPSSGGGRYSNAEVQEMSKFTGSANQVNIFRQGIQNNVLTVENVKGMSSWQDTQNLIKRVFDANAYDKNDRG